MGRERGNRQWMDGKKFVQMPFPPLMPRCNEGRRRLILEPVDSDLVDDLSRDLVGSFGLGWACRGWHHVFESTVAGQHRDEEVAQS